MKGLAPDLETPRSWSWRRRAEREGMQFQPIRRVTARYRFGVALGEANAARKRVQFPDSNAIAIQTHGIRACHFQFQYHGLNADIQTGCKGTSQALRDLFSRLICTKQQSNGIIIYAAPPSTLLYISTIPLKFEDGPPISVILRGNIYTFR